jgi:hypothetical protein
MAVYNIGSQGDEVRKLQEQLKVAGYDPGGIDGIYGPKTKAAVTAYQNANNLTVDGIVGDQTLGSLSKISAGSVSPATPTTPSNTAPKNTTPAITAPTTNPVKEAGLEAKTPAGTTGAYDFFGKSIEKYESPYSAQIQSFLNDVLSTKPFDAASYNPETDAGYVAFKNKALQEGNKAYDSAVAGMSTPGLQDSSIGRQVAESARSTYTNKIQDAIPEFMDRAREDYNQGIAQKYNALNALLGIDETEYGRYADNRDFNYKQKQDYTENTGYMPIDTSAIPADSPLRRITDYQAEINKLEESDPGNPLINIYKALRYEKVMNSPELLEKYGGTLEIPLGYETLAKKSNDLNQEYIQTQIDNMNDDNARAWEELNKPSSSGSGSTLFNGLSNTDVDNLTTRWKALGKADALISRYLGVPEGTPYGGDGNGTGTNYNQFISNYSNEDGEDLYNYLVSGESELKPGSADYLKAIEYARDKYYNTIIDRWRGKYDELKKELASGVGEGTPYANPDYYKEVLGMERYNKLMALKDENNSVINWGQ